MNCRDFINEFEDRNALSETATLHLNDCADCRKINGVQTRVWQIIDKFAPVEAPKDFNFRVKARIANSKPRDFQPSFLPVLRYVLPLSVVGLILAFVIFNGFYSFNDKTVPQIAETNFQAPIQKENQPTKVLENEQIASVDKSPTLDNEKSVSGDLNVKPQPIENKKELKTLKGGTQFVAANSVKKPQPKIARDNEKNSVGSQTSDLASKAPRIFTPKGIPNSNQTTQNPPSFENKSSITAEQILSQLGIESVSENGQRKVKKVSANSVGEHSGVKVGDVIEAIDGEKLTNEPIRAKTIEGKKLTITRGAVKIEILLHN